MADLCTPKSRAMSDPVDSPELTRRCAFRPFWAPTRPVSAFIRFKPLWVEETGAEACMNRRRKLRTCESSKVASSIFSYGLVRAFLPPIPSSS
jgi:hypothetical protein